ncbi:hypothetical protein H696_04803 [Fonticula alba]|uniref:Helicase ATP-binding domain-containing protein n=1 Tax=Fonticula alba TaxID=691883 RepID=A0A058Z334_FONAL|nr:hypothetical protein H696_04803 [Fonticula alba]KCV68511.1 hypothetical protein H696_04803 [Fonticula alba]|eukprot:XP_009496943.1 hypothetical protein H696_04803 [Fonticula alba]
MGKTAVFVISTIQRLSLAEADLSKDHVAVLVLAHTRELAYQIKMEYDRFVKYFPFKVAVFFGGDAIQNNIKTLKEEKPTIVVSTPGRMFDLVNRGEIDLSQLKVFVIDESFC